MIRTHPETGHKSIFVNPGFTSHIKGLTRAESDHLLRFLYDHSVKPQYTVRYHWHTGDLGFWDNRVTQHSVVGDFAGQHRVIQRVTLRGDSAGLSQGLRSLLAAARSRSALGGRSITPRTAVDATASAVRAVEARRERSDHVIVASTAPKTRSVTISIGRSTIRPARSASLINDR